MNATQRFSVFVASSTSFSTCSLMSSTTSGLKSLPVNFLLTRSMTCNALSFLTSARSASVHQFTPLSSHSSHNVPLRISVSFALLLRCLA